MRRTLISCVCFIAVHMMLMVNANNEVETGYVGLADFKQEENQLVESMFPIVHISERARVEYQISRGELRSLTMTVTAYDETTGPITATGTKPRPGIVAVDPDVIPLHSKLYIEGVGIVVAEDVDDEEGYVLDLFITKRQDALDWGRQKRKVYIIERGAGR